MTLGLLLHPQRANRLIQQKSLYENQLGLNDVLNMLIENSFNKNHESTYLDEVQQMINVNVLKQIMNLAVNDNAFLQVNALAYDALDKISELVNDRRSKIPYASQYARMINEFKEHPEKFKLENSPKIPDGSPIGTDSCSYISN
jgi:hypothetical protein